MPVRRFIERKVQRISGYQKQQVYFMEDTYVYTYVHQQDTCKQGKHSQKS
jgi:hypothetical protein